MKKIIATLLIAATMLALSVAAFAAPTLVTDPESVKGQGPKVLTADMLYAGLDSNNQAAIAPHQIVKSWHGYNIKEKNSDGIVLICRAGQDRNNENFEIEFVYSHPDAQDGKHAPTLSTVDNPIFAVKYKFNAAAATYAATNEAKNGAYICINRYNDNAAYNSNKVTFATNPVADEWQYFIFDVSTSNPYNTYLSEIADGRRLHFKPFNGWALPEGAEMTIAYMGFFADENAAKTYGQSQGGTPGNPGTADATSIAVLAAVAALGTGIVISKKRR